MGMAQMLDGIGTRRVDSELCEVCLVVVVCEEELRRIPPSA